MSSLIFAESLFVVFFASALLLLGMSIYRKNPKLLIFAGALLAFSALARAVAFPLLVLVPLAAFIGWGVRLPWRHLALSGIVAMLIVSPWLLFNLQTFGSLEFSSTSSRNLYQDNAMQFERWRYPDKEPFFTRENAERLVGVERVQTVEGAHELGAIAKDFILQHPIEYAFFHVLYMPRLFIHDGYNDVYHRLTGVPLETGSSLYDLAASADVSVIKTLIEHPATILSLLPKLVFALVALLVLAHPLLAWRSDPSLLRVSIFFVLFVILYAFLMSPVGQARLRFPIHPILFLLALDSMRLLVPQIRARPFVARS